MKRFLYLSVLLIMLSISACAPGGGEGKCAKGVCVKLHSVSAIKKNASIAMTIKAKVDKDMPDFDVTMMIYPGGIIEDLKDKSNVSWKEKNGITWKKKMKAGEEITITQNVRVDEPGDYTVMVMIGPIDVRTGVVLRITEEGGTEYQFDTFIPSVTPAPRSTITPGPSPTLLPTDEPPTAIPTEAPAPTEPAYPQP